MRGEKVLTHLQLVSKQQYCEQQYGTDLIVL
jgi:hypothetical protein